MALFDHTFSPFLVDKWNAITFTADEDLVMGQIKQVGDTLGLVYQSVLDTNPGVLIYEISKAWVPKATGVGTAFTVGKKLWLNTTTMVVSPTQGEGDVFFGIAIEACTDDDAKVFAHVKGV